MEEPPILPPERLDVETLALAQDRFFEADALADEALEAVATFAHMGDFTRRVHVAQMARLTMLAAEAEARRGHARAKFAWELVRFTKPKQEDNPPW